jgi:hypothetical protein
MGTSSRGHEWQVRRGLVEKRWRTLMHVKNIHNLPLEFFLSECVGAAAVTSQLRLHLLPMPAKRLGI